MATESLTSDPEKFAAAYKDGDKKARAGLISQIFSIEPPSKRDAFKNDVAHSIFTKGGGITVKKTRLAVVSLNSSYDTERVKPANLEIALRENTPIKIASRSKEGESICPQDILNAYKACKKGKEGQAARAAITQKITMIIDKDQALYFTAIVEQALPKELKSEFAKVKKEITKPKPIDQKRADRIVKNFDITSSEKFEPMLPAGKNKDGATILLSAENVATKYAETFNGTMDKRKAQELRKQITNSIVGKLPPEQSKAFSTLVYRALPEECRGNFEEERGRAVVAEGARAMRNSSAINTNSVSTIAGVGTPPHAGAKTR